MATGLDQFHRYLREIRKVAGWVLPTAGVTPVIASLVGLNPPWPNRIPLTVATAGVVLFTLVAVFQFLDGREKTRVDRAIRRSLVCAIAISVAYLTLFALLVFEPKNGTAFVKGFECTREALQLFRDSCPWLDEQQLRTVEYEETVLWTARSIFMARVLLVLMWCGTFIALATCMGAFVRHQAQRQLRPPAAQTPA